MSKNTPTLNNMQSVSWYAQIPGYEELTIKLVDFEIPEVTAGTTDIPNRTEFAINESGNSITYEPLTLKFLLDENMLNYRKLYRWMRANSHKGQAEMTSIFVHILGNNKKFQGVELEFLDAHPISFSTISLDTNGNDTDLECTVVFKYLAFDFIDETDVHEH